MTNPEERIQENETKNQGDGSKKVNRQPRHPVLRELEAKGGIRELLKEPYHITKSSDAITYSRKANLKKEGVVTKFFPKIPYEGRWYAIYKRLVESRESSKDGRSFTLFACNPTLVEEILSSKRERRSQTLNNELTRGREFNSHLERNASVIDERRYEWVNSSSVCFDYTLQGSPSHSINILVGKREHIDGGKELVMKLRHYDPTQRGYVDEAEFSQEQIPESVARIEDLEYIEERVKEKVLKTDTSQK